MLPFVLGVGSLLFTSLVHGQPYTPICRVVLDGRVSQAATPQTFDGANSNPFNPTYALGENVRFSQIIKFPSIQPSVFDWKSKPIQISINDKSLYREQGSVRRAGLTFSQNTGTDDVTNTGVKTFHWSIHQPPHGSRPLNLTHEYMNVWHVRNDDRGFQFQLTTGELLKNTGGHPFTHWKILDRNENVVFATLMDFKEWENFAVTLDFDKNTMRVYYSKGNDELKEVTGVLQNDNSGRGRFQIGIFKKPTQPNGDYLKSGFQETDFEETQIYGGIYVEDSANSCVTK